MPRDRKRSWLPLAAFVLIAAVLIGVAGGCANGATVISGTTEPPIGPDGSTPEPPGEPECKQCGPSGNDIGTITGWVGSELGSVCAWSTGLSAPMANVPVTLTTGGTVATTMTDAEGCYCFGGVAKASHSITVPTDHGSYTVDCDADSATVPGQIDVTLGPSDTWVQDNDFGYKPMP